MGASPLFSVIVPMYNSETTVVRAVHTILSQSFTDFELITVDDGSSDQTLDRVLEVASADTRVRVESLRENRGQGPARNHGIDLAEGRYLVFVDADDELCTGALAEIARTIGDKQPDIVLLGAEEVRKKSKRLITDSSLLNKLGTTEATVTVSSEPRVLMWPVATWSKVYRTDFINHHSIRFPEGFHQDIPWSVSTTLLGKSISGVDYCCYRYIKHGPGTSTTTSKGEKTLSRIAQIQRIRVEHDIDSLPATVLSHLVALVAVHLIAGNRAAYRTIPEHLHRQFFLDSSAELRWWFHHAIPGREVDSDPLLPTKERVFFQEALLSGDFSTWQRAHDDHRKKLRRKRRLDLSRYRLFK